MKMRRMMMAVVIGAGLIAVGGLPATASAQNEIRISARSAGPAGGGAGGQVTKRSVERYAEILGLTAEQKEAVLAVHEGYSASFEQARKARRTGMEDLRRSAEDTGDHSVFMEKMPAIERDYREATTNLEKNFFSDLRSVLTEAQEAKWQTVERLRRRETSLRGGALSGESVDLIDLVGTLKAPSDVASNLAPALDEYEMEMDRRLIAREASRKDMPQFGAGSAQLDLEAMQAAMEASRKEGERIVELNERTAAKIQAMLPEDLAKAFASEYRKRSFPRVYRTSRVSRDVEAALKFGDLDGSQREALEALRASYERDAGAANSKWADAVRESERSGQQGGVFGGPGGPMMVTMGDEPEPLQQARKARREIDDRAGETLKSILRPEQRERLPKAPPEGDAGEGGGEGGQMMFMLREDRAETKK